nr:hypothetical protein [Anaerolineae bacterium]
MTEKMDGTRTAISLPYHSEDRTGIMLEPAALIHARQDIADKKAGLIEATWADLARKHLPLLRQTRVVQPLHTMALQQAVRTLTYQQTGPLSEVEERRWLDSYTGELIDDEQEIEDELDDPDIRRKNRQSLPVSDWTRYLYERRPYPTDELNAQFIAANRDYIGSEDDDFLPDDDRGYLPESLLPEYTSQIADLGIEMRADVQALRRRIDQEIEHARSRVGKMGFPYEIPRIRRRVQNSAEAEQFLASLQSMVWKYEPEDIAEMFSRFQHGFCFDVENGAQILCSNGLTVDEILEDLDLDRDGRPGVHLGEPRQQEIADTADAMLREYLDTMDVDDTSVVRSRYWVEGYIQAVLAGAPLYSTDDGKKSATDLAWEFWRSRTSKAGYEAYLQAKMHGADRKTAGRAFYVAARAAGEIASSQSKEITGVLPHGLRIKHGDADRVVTYRVAGLIAQNEGFRLSQDKRGKLVELLQSRGWGSELLTVL